MPELNPCPACGSDNVECLVCTINADEKQDVHFHIACEACYTSGPIADNGKIAADKWNFLPRRPDYNDVDCAGCPERRRGYLTWTTEPPKVEHVGKWFWSKIPGQSMAVPVIVAELDGVLGIGRGTSEQGLTMQKCREFGVKFAGPIPTPLEPEES